MTLGSVQGRGGAANAVGARDPLCSPRFMPDDVISFEFAL